MKRIMKYRLNVGLLPTQRVLGFVLCGALLTSIVCVALMLSASSQMPSMLSLYGDIAPDTSTSNIHIQRASYPIREANNNALQTDSYLVEVSISSVVLSVGETAMVSVAVRDPLGQPVAGELVTLFGSLGTILPDNVITNAQGEASAIYKAVAESGDAVIQALVGSANDSATIQIMQNMDITPFPTGTPNSETPMSVTPTVTLVGESGTPTPMGTSIQPTSTPSNTPVPPIVGPGDTLQPSTATPIPTAPRGESGDNSLFLPFVSGDK